jgi:DNA-binding XRE family transcriptional regulator
MVSNIGDSFQKKWNQPEWKKIFSPYSPDVTREEYEALKKEVEDMKKKLIEAKIYDIETNQPDCEMEDKVKILKEIAKLFNIDLSDVFGDDKK